MRDPLLHGCVYFIYIYRYCSDASAYRPSFFSMDDRRMQQKSDDMYICIFCMTCIYIFILLSRWNSCYETSALCVIAQRRSFVTWTRSKKLLRACVCHVIQVPSFMKFDIIYTVLMYFGILCSCVCVYTRVYLVLDAFPCEGRLLTI